MLQLGLRLGADPRAIVTTTPRPGPVLSGIMAEPDCVVIGGPTDANPHNSARWRKRHAGAATPAPASSARSWTASSSPTIRGRCGRWSCWRSAAYPLSLHAGRGRGWLCPLKTSLPAETHPPADALPVLREGKRVSPASSSPSTRPPATAPAASSPAPATGPAGPTSSPITRSPSEAPKAGPRPSPTPPEPGPPSTPRPTSGSSPNRTRAARWSARSSGSPTRTSG